VNSYFGLTHQTLQNEKLTLIVLHIKLKSFFIVDLGK
jgi:hypothetical protein